MSKAVAFLAGLGAGYLEKQRKNKDDERQAARDARETEVYEEGKADRAAARAERDQGTADKNALRTAAAPLAVTEIRGTAKPGEAEAGALASDNPTVGGYQVGAQQFAAKGAGTDAAMAAANTPEATRSRVSAAMMAQGNVLGADQLATSGMQQKAAGMAIKKGEREEAQQVFSDGLRKAVGAGPDAIAAFMSESSADGKGGAMKFQAAKNSDGTWQMMRVGDDGVNTPFGGRYSGDEAGLIKAGYDLDSSIKPEAKVAHLMAVQEAGRRAKHDDGALAVSQANSAEAARHNKATEANARAQLAATEAHRKAIADGKTTAGAAIQIGLKDMRDFEGDLDKYIKDQFPVKDGADPKERGLMNAQATQMKANGSSIFQNNAAIGIPLTAGTVLQALELTKDPKNIMIVPDSSGNKFKAVVVNGQKIAVSGPLEKVVPANTPAAVAKSAGTVPPNSVPSVPVQQPTAVNPMSPASIAARDQIQISPGWK